MRTCFEIAERDAYHAARDLLVRRCRDWSRSQGRPSDEVLLSAALDSRHFSPDGRLTYWTPEHVRRFLLEWIPQYMKVTPDEVKRAPDVLRTLLQYFRDLGLRDPRGAALVDNEAAIDAAAEKFPAALKDLADHRGARLWDPTTLQFDVDVADPRERVKLQQYIRRHGDEVDPDQLESLLAVQAADQPPGEERTLAQFPVSLPSHDALLAEAEQSLVSRRLRLLLDWLGEDGQPLNVRGFLSAGRARKLAAAMRLEDMAIKSSSNDHPQLRLYLSLAKQMRLVRRFRGRLVPVAKAAPLLEQPVALWRRAFDALEELGDIVCHAKPSGMDVSMLSVGYAETLRDVLNSLYSLPEPMPIQRLDETVWQHSCGAYFDIDVLEPSVRKQQREYVGRDLNRMWNILAEFGVVEIIVGEVDDMFVRDLQGDNLEQDSPFDAETTAALAAELAQPVELVQLTDLGTAVLRERLVTEGREAGIIGELAYTDAAEMLSVVTQHYPQRSRATEVSGWMLAHRTDIEAIVDAARIAPFRSRASAILELVYDVEPQAPKILRSMRSDPLLAPSALLCLVETGTLDLLDLTDPERQLLTAESSLRLMEIDGPEAIIDGLEELPISDAQAVMDRVLASGHPDTKALEEFRELVVMPIARNRAARPHPPVVPPHRLGATRRARARRGGRN